MPQDNSANQGIERTAAILRALGRNFRSGARLTDIAAATELSKSTVHRLLNGLVQVGFVEHDPQAGVFHLSFDLFVLGSAAANRHGIVEIARPSLTRLEQRTSDTVFLSARSGIEAICIDRCEGSFPIKALTLNVGDRRPLGIGAGSLALLAFLPDAEVEHAIEGNLSRLGSYPRYSGPLLHDMVARTRRLGYAINDGNIIPEMFAVGAPILGRDRRPVAALSVAAIAGRVKGDRRTNLIEWIRSEARLLEDRIADLTADLADSRAARFGQRDFARR